MKKLLAKTLSVTAIIFSLATSHSMEFLSTKGRDAAEKFKHAEFDVSHGKLKGITLKMTPELSAHTKNVDNCIVQELNALFSKNYYPKRSLRYIKDFSDEFLNFGDLCKPTLYFDYIGEIIEEYIDRIDNLLRSDETIRQQVVDDITLLLRESLTKYKNDLFLHLEPSQITSETKRMYAPFFLEHSKANLLNFSEPISSELFAKLSHEQVSAYGFKPENIRIITANSILKALGNLGTFGKEREAFYGGLLVQSPGSDSQLLALYEKLFNDADYFGIVPVLGELTVASAVSVETDDKLYKSNCMKSVETSLSSNSGREALVLFLATHEYISKSSGKEKLIFLSSDGDNQGGYPIFDVSVPSDTNAFVSLTLPKFGGETSTFGYKKDLTRDNAAMFRHELKHGINTICGLASAGIVPDNEYHGKYVNYPFLKELLFSDFDKIRTEIKNSIEALSSKLSAEDRMACFDSIKEHFHLNINRPIAKPTISEDFLGDTEHRTAVYSDVHEDSSTGSTTKIPNRGRLRNRSNDGDTFVDDMAFKLALEAIDLIWHDPEEINNMIGVQLMGDTLFVNMLSDMDYSFLEKRQPFHWTHQAAINTTGVKRIEELVRSIPDPNARTFMNEFFAKYMLTTSPLNHPTERALNTLIKLHGVN